MTSAPRKPNVLTDPFMQLLLAQRQSALMLVDALEKTLGISPTTAEIRRMYKKNGFTAGENPGYNSEEEPNIVAERKPVE